MADIGWRNANFKLSNGRLAGALKLGGLLKTCFIFGASVSEAMPAFTFNENSRLM